MHGTAIVAQTKYYYADHTIAFKSFSTDMNTSWEGRQVKDEICRLR
jgi:hypothetical protein